MDCRCTKASSPDAPRRILCVGLTCVDIISVVDSYPKEDSDNRCLRQTWCRGGNASNNATVLAILGNDNVACLSCLSGKDFLRQFVLEDFASFGLDPSFLAFYRQCRMRDRGKSRLFSAELGRINKVGLINEVGSTTGAWSLSNICACCKRSRCRVENE